MVERCTADYDDTIVNADSELRGLDFTPPHHETLAKSTPIIVVCHGLTGGSHESYVRNVLCWAVKPVKEGGLGARAVVINVRHHVPFLVFPTRYSALTLHLVLHLRSCPVLWPKSIRS